MFGKKQFHELINEQMPELKYEDELSDRIKEAENLLAKYPDKTIAPYEITITIKAKTWRALLWQFAVLLDSAMRGPEGIPASGASSDGTSYSLSLKSGRDVLIIEAD